MKIAAFPAPSGSAVWRLVDPFKHLKKFGIEAEIAREGINDEIAEWADAYVLQNTVSKEGIALLYAHQQENGKKIIVDMDDFFELNDDNPYKLYHEMADAKSVIKKTLEIADLVTTTNKYLKSKLEKYARNVVVLPNYPDKKRWDVQPKHRNTSKTLRIGWAGSFTHLDDLKMITPALKRICAEFPVQLVFTGEMRIKEHLQGLPVECIPGVPIEAWPHRLAGLRLDIGLAPLRDTEFNKCKSNIKFYEYSLAKIPGIYSDVVYKLDGSGEHRDQTIFDGNWGTICTTQEEWYQAIKNYITHPELRDDIANRAYTYVSQSCMLDDHASEWAKAYKNLLLTSLS